MGIDGDEFAAQGRVTPDEPYGKIAGLLRARHLAGLNAFSEGGYERRRG
jgi:hypothetical protein